MATVAIDCRNLRTSGAVGRKPKDYPMNIIEHAIERIMGPGSMGRGLRTATVAAFAGKYGVHRNSVWGWIRRGTLLGVEVGLATRIQGDAGYTGGELLGPIQPQNGLSVSGGKSNGGSSKKPSASKNKKPRAQVSDD